MTGDSGPAPESSLDRLFAALADPVRRRLLITLIEHGPQSATKLADWSPATRRISRQAVVKHLQFLDASGLVTSERIGREVRYRAVPERMAAAVGWMLDAGASWDRRIDRLRRQQPAPLQPASRTP